MDNILNQGAIWDLHIHTCKCPKGSSEFSNCNVNTFVDALLKKISEYPNLQMISFTDHNVISIEVYQEFIKKGNLPFLVGIEVDTFFTKDENDKYKHLIIYFDINSNNFDENIPFMESLNNFINLKPMYIYDLLEYIIESNIPFALSPHAFKQEKRAINDDWADENNTKSKSKKYMDQFYCFWEAAGHSSIIRAIEFLKDFDMNEKISIISFSDSNNFNKFEQYLSQPSQYFRALPSFKGLQMVASESSRIVDDLQLVKEDDYGNLIGAIEVDGNIVKLSNRLNAIIGGRGSGKSLILDSIAECLKDNSVDDQNRRKFIRQRNIKVLNYENNEIEKNSFLFDYYKQSYVSSLFNSNDYDVKIKEHFADSFRELDEINVEEIKNSNKKFFENNLLEYNNEKVDENISNFINTYCVLNDKIFKNSLQIKDKSKTKNINANNYDVYFGKVINIIPKELQSDADIIRKIYELDLLLCTKIHDYNDKNIDESILKNLVIDKYKNYKDGKSDKSKRKASIENLFIKTIDEKGMGIRKRVNLVNSYLKCNSEFKDYYETVKAINGSVAEAFIIKNVLQIEKPLDFLIKKLNEYFYKNELPSEDDGNYHKKMLEYYCFESDKKLKDGKILENLDTELLDYKLEYKYHPVILYKNNGVYENIEQLSPGTQTNVLMEYLVYKDTRKPLLIDQPEDNVDNYTIYNKLREWFSNLKISRQVIVVTHDANIVINADAENVILASHNKQNEFKYSYGALEYSNNLDHASDILDGGREAVKRRLMKYGE